METRASLASPLQSEMQIRRAAKCRLGLMKVDAGEIVCIRRSVKMGTRDNISMRVRDLCQVAFGDMSCFCKAGRTIGRFSQNFLSQRHTTAFDGINLPWRTACSCEEKFLRCFFIAANKTRVGLLNGFSLTGFDFPKMTAGEVRQIRVWI